jgi:hypothetical protein
MANMFSFIPRCEDIVDRTGKRFQSSLTDLPITQEQWEKLAQAFRFLHGDISTIIRRKETYITSIACSHEGQPIYMQMGMTKTGNGDNTPFALASTHVTSAKATFAIIFGCSDEQVEKVHSLLERSDEGIKHSLLMIGICAELHLDRLKTLVDNKVFQCAKTTRLIDPGEASGTHHDDGSAEPKREITWDLIERVRRSRNESKRAEEEVKATTRQLRIALPDSLLQRLDRSSNDKSNSDKTGDDLVMQKFANRFADIFAKFDSLLAECSIAVEDMQFTADMVGKVSQISLVTVTKKFSRFEMSWQDRKQGVVGKRRRPAILSLLWLCFTYQRLLLLWASESLVFLEIIANPLF